MRRKSPVLVVRNSSQCRAFVLKHKGKLLKKKIKSKQKHHHRKIRKKYKHLATYEERNNILEKMGFLSYKDYLISDLWQSIRTRVLEEHNKCKCCGEPATQVHHQNYTKKNLRGKNLLFLIPLCQKCHYKIEFSESGNKKTLIQTHVYTEQLIKKC